MLWGPPGLLRCPLHSPWPLALPTGRAPGARLQGRLWQGEPHSAHLAGLDWPGTVCRDAWTFTWFSSASLRRSTRSRAPGPRQTLTRTFLPGRQHTHVVLAWFLWPRLVWNTEQPLAWDQVASTGHGWHAGRSVPGGAELVQGHAAKGVLFILDFHPGRTGFCLAGFSTGPSEGSFLEMTRFGRQ